MSSHTPKQPFTFAQIIEADHFTIERLAAQIRSPSTQASQRKPLLLECTWRLIRHDFSEELVMRPAFIQHLGEEGVRMVEHDRADHARARDALKPLLQLDLENDSGYGLNIIAAVFDELAKHMALESGEMIPQFEKAISELDGSRLATEYARTVVVMPQTTRIDGQSRKPCFENGVIQYINSSLEDLKEVYNILQNEAEVSSSYFDKMVAQELARINVGKWTSYVEREAQRRRREVQKGRI